MLIVCDTNVIISAFVFPGGNPDKIFRSILSGRFLHATSPDLLTEVRKVLSKKFELPTSSVETGIELIVRCSVLIYPVERLEVIKEDPSDNRVLECAKEAGADCIVSGDKKHLLPLREFNDIKILSPSQFVQLYRLVS